MLSLVFHLDSSDGFLPRGARSPRPLPHARGDFVCGLVCFVVLAQDPLHSDSIWKNSGDTRGTHFSIQ